MPAGRTLLIGIGAQKAGTTWLAEYLANHPDVFMSPIKELHYFDAIWRPDLCAGLPARIFRRYQQMAAAPPFDDPEKERERRVLVACYHDRLKMDRDESEYLNYFLSRAGDRPVMCEITPSYSLLNADGFERISSLHSDVKFVFLIRNPIDRFWSQLRYSRAFGAQGTPRALIERGLSDPQVVLRTRYDRTLEALREAANPERIFVEFYERLFADEALARFCAFTGIAFRRGDYDHLVNRSPSEGLSETDRARIYAGLAPVYSWARTEYGDELPESWKHDIAAWDGSGT
jgi:hypothetical protein